MTTRLLTLHSILKTACLWARFGAIATSIHKDITWPARMHRTAPVWLGRFLTLPHPVMSLQIPFCYESFTLMGCLHLCIRWYELKRTHENNYCELGSQRHCVGPSECQMLCCTDVVGQECHLTSQTESRPGLVSFINVKVSHSDQEN